MIVCWTILAIVMDFYLNIFPVGTLSAVIVLTYFIGLASLVRHMVRRQLPLAITWVAVILINFAWFVFMATLGVEHFRPSGLFVLCLIAAFKIMRYKNYELQDSLGSSATTNDDIRAWLREQNDENKTIMQTSAAKTRSRNPLAYGLLVYGPLAYGSC